ncbi:MAG: hypothetical protein ACI38A_10290 [Candidatus Ornithomonoglobus sp.]
MVNLIKGILKKWQRNEKEIMIKKSGSTRSGGNEKIRAGQSYLYKKYGMESEVIEIRFRDTVSGSYLNMALQTSLRRYPYINTRLIEKDGDFYIVQNEQSMVAKRTQKLARLGHISCGYHLIDITYYGCSVFVAFHHALCDGRGIKPFTETLIYYYCRQRYKVSVPPEGVRLAKNPLLEGETDDPFNHRYDYDENREFPSLSRDAYPIPENTETEVTGDYRYELKLSHAAFMNVCRESNATPVILLSLLMNRAIARLYPDYDKPINANIAMDMREALDAPNTFKNCVRSVILPYSRDFAALPLKEQAAEYRKMLAQQRNRDFCRKEANNMIGLFDKLDTLSSYEEKQSIMSFFEGMTLNTYIISYLGQFLLGGSAEHIDSIHLYNSGSIGLGINMISCGDSFVLDFKQSFSSDKYVQAFCRELDALKLGYIASDAIAFTTPGDSVIKRTADK